MAKLAFSPKRLQIDKANTTVVAVIVVATIVVISCLVASRALLAKRSFQSRVIREKSKTAKQLTANIAAVDSLVNSYKEFSERPVNIIGGTAAGTSERDGDNAKITLDALPSKYDFPALATSLEKLLVQKNFKINAISGSDDEIAQQNTTGANPEPVEIPFSISVSGAYDPMLSLIELLEKSIRPIQLKAVSFTANSSEVQLDLDAKTYYIPEKQLTITTKVVK